MKTGQTPGRFTVIIPFFNDDGERKERYKAFVYETVSKFFPNIRCSWMENIKPLYKV